ncbi:extracellular mutant protein 11-domain-containing protein [Hypomontagnella submonticulosa]|nr:extracellular mutant protein 11-domain-containing protein [Hypomontagnella submonticulosa]
MPPASQFLKHSKTKMQAWVTSNGLAGSQPAPVGSGPGSGHDNQGHLQSHLPQRHVFLPQPAPPSSTQPVETTQAPQNSPPRSRAPIINANSNRAAAVTAARLPVPAGRTGHARDASLNMSRATRAVASEPIQSSQRPAPFWEGSTVDGSLFSDSASNVDANAAVTSMYRMPFRGPTYRSRGDTPRPRPPAKEEASVVEQHAPFIIGPNGVIDVVGGPLTRSASTPDARTHRGGLKGVSSPEPDPDQESEDSPYQTSPEKTPSAKRLHHPKALALRTNRRGSFSERTSYPQGNSMPSPQRPTYQGLENDVDEARSERSGQHLRVETQRFDPRSTIFADTETPAVSHPDESDRESIEPQPAPKPVPKSKPQINRQLFPNGTKIVPRLHESPMPRPVEKRISNPKKRQIELDYDDGALAAMDYADLKNEAFDFDPAQAEAQSVIGPPRGTLPEKLYHFLDKDHASQLEFFSKMPVKDWDESGDWFLERFGEVVQRLRDTRRTKRALIEGFENEIAERDAAVRNKIQGIDHTLAELKSEGEGMMLGKEFD